MREVLPELMAWWRDGEVTGVGTVVGTWRSAPRPPGASMLVGPDRSAVGSVSGGCVEGAVYELAEQVMADGHPVLERYGVSDEDAFAVGLTCGGILDVFVEKVSQETFPQLGSVAEDIEAGRPVAVVTVVDHPDPAWLGKRLVVRPEGEGISLEGNLESDRVKAAIADDARGLLASGRSEMLTYGPGGPAQGRGDAGLLCVLCAQAKDARLRCDRLCGSRGPAGVLPRLPGDRVRRPAGLCHRLAVPLCRRGGRGLAASLLSDQAAAGAIDSRTVMCVLTHDPKFDVPLLEVALRLPEVAYIGAMGSRRTHADLMRRLREAGLSDDEMARLVQPDRSRSRRPDARGDSRLHRGGDHLLAVGRGRRSPGADGWAHPS
jgi:xanthine dehydrogenase accessory factor